MQEIENNEIKKQKKEIFLKQYMVREDCPDGIFRSAFILQTCGAKAREEFMQKFPGSVIVDVMVTAESRTLKKEDAGKKLWKNGANWITEHKPDVDSPCKKRYFELKRLVEENQAKQFNADAV